MISGRSSPSLCIHTLKVLGWRPRIAAAPSLPSMRHRVSERVLRIWFHSISSKVLMVDDMGGMKSPVYLRAARPARSTGSRPLKDTFELPDVPGPRVILECLHRLLLDRCDLFPQFSGASFYEGLDQQRDVFLPLPQRRRENGPLLPAAAGPPVLKNPCEKILFPRNPSHNP